MDYKNATDGKETVISQEGEDQQEIKEYIKPLPTELILERTFKVPGTQYHVQMESQNLHNPDDAASLLWKIECEHPIIPSEWAVEFDKFQHVKDHFSISFIMTKPQANLPTKVQNIIIHYTIAHNKPKLQSALKGSRVL